MDSITFNLCPGTWHVWFRHKETFVSLTPIMVIDAFKDIQWTYPVPEEIRNDKNAVFMMQRVR